MIDDLSLDWTNAALGQGVIIGSLDHRHHDQVKKLLGSSIIDA
jgi:hypothetical protein